MKFKIQILSELPSVARQILAAFPDTKVFTLEGEMGAGKTTLVKVICEQLGVSGQTSSPTFSIINEYTSREGKKIYHFDLHRLKNDNELLQLGAEEYFYSGNYCFIEWPSLAAKILPSDHIPLKIRVEGDARIIDI